MEGSLTTHGWGVCFKSAKLGFENQETGSSKYRYPKQKHMIHMIHWYTPFPKFSLSCNSLSNISRIHPTHKIPTKIGVDAVFHPLQSQLFRQPVEIKHCCNHLRGGPCFAQVFAEVFGTDVRCSTGCSAPKKSTVPSSERLVLLTLAISWSSARGSAISPTILGVVASTPWKWWWVRVTVRQRRHFLKHKVHCYST